MLIPLSTDRPPKRRPIVNETIVIINLLVYIIGLVGYNFEWFERNAVATWGHFWMDDFKIWQLFTYQFIHDPFSIWHIAFNLLFLWVFGNAVESRLGRTGYLCFYLTAGIVAGLAHGIADPTHPVIGASGAIAGVTGGFLALFPRARIKILFFFFIVGIWFIPATWFILFYFAIDILKQTMSMFGGSGNVAYAAHIAGNVFGFSICFALLATNVLKREEYDIFFLFKQQRRRAALRQTVKQNPGVWDQPGSGTPEQVSSKMKVKPLSERDMRYAEQRSEISQLLKEHDLEGAAAKYKVLLKFETNATMPEARQLDLANYFYQQDDIHNAAKAYELLLKAFPTCRDAVSAKLILAIIYTRKNRKASRAKELIEEVKPRLQSDGERALAEQLLEELETES